MTTWSRWPMATLGRVATFYAGGSLPDGEPFEGQEGGYLLTRVSDLNASGNETFLKRTKLWNISPGPRSATYPPGSLLFPKRGGAIGTNKKRITTRPGVLDPNLMAIFPSDALHIEYLYHWFLTFDLATIANGSSVPQLNKKDLDPLRLPLPPVDMQRRIAEVLDSAAALLRKRHDGISLLDDLRRSLFLELFGDPRFNPREWPMRSMADLFSAKPTYGTMIPGGSEGDWLCLRVANIQNWELDLSSQKFVDLPAAMIARHEVRKGDILLARAIATEEQLGKAIVVYPGDCKWAFDSHLMRLRFDESCVSPEYVVTLLNTDGGRRSFLKMTRRSAVQYNINSKEISEFEIPVPPIELQAEFAMIAQSLDALKDRERSGLAELDLLFSSLQHRAFREHLWDTRED